MQKSMFCLHQRTEIIYTNISPQKMRVDCLGSSLINKVRACVDIQPVQLVVFFISLQKSSGKYLILGSESSKEVMLQKGLRGSASKVVPSEACERITIL